jgi:hypothetical protein
MHVTASNTILKLDRICFTAARDILIYIDFAYLIDLGCILIKIMKYYTANSISGNHIPSYMF